MGSVWVGDNEYYTYDDIDKTGAKYRIIIGERSNGKTYGFKQKALLNFVEHGKQFAYLRRFEEEVLPKRLGAYWSDLTDWALPILREHYPYESFLILPKAGKWTLYGYGDNIKKKEAIGDLGYYFSLNQTIYDKSTAYPDINLICFEEFITDKRELTDEFTTFINFISTIKRKRTDVTVYMLANTINRNSQILEAMHINVRDLAQGEIKKYTYYGDDGVENTVAIEYCRHYAQTGASESYFVFGHQQEDMIVKGTWQTKAYPQFSPDEFYSMSPQFGVILNTDSIKLYVYVTQDKKGDLKGYVSENRLSSRIDYFTFNNKTTNPQFSSFNFSSNLPGALKLQQVLYTMFVNGAIKYESNLVGCDFEHIMTDYLLKRNI